MNSYDDINECQRCTQCFEGMYARRCAREGPDAECTNFAAAEFVMLSVGIVYSAFILYIIATWMLMPLVSPKS